MNRHTRRAVQAITKAPKQPKPPKNQQAEQNAKVMAMIRGKVPPPNKYAKYALDKLLEAKKEVEQLNTAIQETEKRLSMLKEQNLIAMGFHNSSGQALEEFIKDEEEKPKEGKPDAK